MCFRCMCLGKRITNVQDTRSKLKIKICKISSNRYNFNKEVYKSIYFNEFYIINFFKYSIFYITLARHLHLLDFAARRIVSVQHQIHALMDSVARQQDIHSTDYKQCQLLLAVTVQLLETTVQKAAELTTENVDLNKNARRMSSV